MIVVRLYSPGTTAGGVEEDGEVLSSSVLSVDSEPFTESKITVKGSGVLGLLVLDVVVSVASSSCSEDSSWAVIERMGVGWRSG